MKKHCTVFVCLLSLWVFQGVWGQVATIKLGLQRWDRFTNPALFAVESRIGERLTFQPEFAIGHRTHFREYPTIRGNLQMGVQGRGYLLLRQGRYFCGLYTGLYVLHHRFRWPHDHPTVAFTRQYFTSGGLLLGFQQAFWTRMRVDGGMKLGYSGGTYNRTYNRAGGLVSESQYDGGFVGYLFIQVGYAF
jgi:hypothetical protein